MKSFFRLLKIIRPYWKEIVYSIILGSLTIGSGIALLATSSFLISMAALHTSIADLQIAIVGVRFFGISRGAFRYVERLVSHSVNFKILAKLRVEFYKSLIPIIPVRSQEIQSGDLLSRIVTDIEALQDFFVRVIAPPFISIIIGGVYLLFLGNYSPELAYILGIIYIVSGIVIPLVVVAISGNYESRIFELKGELTKHLVESMQGMNELIMLRQIKNQQHVIEELNKKIALMQRRTAFVTTLNSSVSAFFTNFGPWVVLFFVIPLVLNQSISGVLLAALVLSSMASFEMINQLSQSAEYLQISLQAADRIFETIDMVDINSKPSEKMMIRDLKKLDIREMYFSYSGVEDFSLKDIKFDLTPGKKIAIVGPSGAGKTTIINILNGFWKQNKGTYTINGIESHNIRDDSLTDLFGICEQDAYIFSGTLRSNLDFEAGDIDQNKINQIIKYVQLSALVEELPDGLDTLVGEHGKSFSSGELQRILIARTLLKESKVLIFDEPTSNLDAINEREIMRMILNLEDDRPIILITHRLIGMQKMDEILLVDKGEIKERGSHMELVSSGGEYAKMWEIQQQLIRSV